MKKTMLLLFLAALSVSAGECLKNKQWTKDLSGWNIRDTRKPKQGPRDQNTKAASVRDGVLTIDTDRNRSEVMVIQYGLALKKGVTYRLSFEVKSQGPAAYRCVAFYFDKDAAGKPKWVSVGGTWLSLKGNEGWQKRTISFQLPKYRDGGYCYFAAASGVVQFRNASLTEAAAPKPPAKK